MNNLNEIFLENPIIGAIKNDNDLEMVLKSNASIVFVLYGNIMSISAICKKIATKDKVVFIHLDLIDGLKADHRGVDFIKKYADPYGVISTKTSNIRYAKQIGLKTVLRIFALDSLSLSTGLKNIYDTKPDAVEVMPGVASKIISSINKNISIPVIAGGLIQTKKDIMDALSSGAVAISTTKNTLWNC
ncbi:glycerol-3-phosphate responsive antiterminator [Clostridium sp. DL1XJH146]